MLFVRAKYTRSKTRRVLLAACHTVWHAAAVCSVPFGWFAMLPARAEETPAAARMEKVIDGFAASLAANRQLDEAQRTKVLEMVAEMRKDPDLRDVTLTESLRVLYPEFAAALLALGQEETSEAVERLGKLTQAEDPFLAAGSSFYLARAHMLEDRFEQALPLLSAVLGRWSDKTLQAGEALFLRGVCESHLLRREQAMTTLGMFLEQNPDAPERMRVGALRLLTELEHVTEGSLGDVQQRMSYSRRRLGLEDVGPQTRQVQQEAVALLDKLIEEAEDRESQGGGSSSASGQGRSQGQGGGAEEGGGPGEGEGADQPDDRAREDDAPHRRHIGGEGSAFGHLRDKEREAAAFAAIKARFPARYQQLVEQYYRSLQEDRE